MMEIFVLYNYSLESLHFIIVIFEETTSFFFHPKRNLIAIGTCVEGLMP